MHPATKRLRAGLDGLKVGETLAAGAVGLLTGGSIANTVLPYFSVRGVGGLIADVSAAAVLGTLSSAAVFVRLQDREVVRTLRSIAAWDHAMREVVRKYPYVIVHARASALLSKRVRDKCPRYAAALESRVQNEPNGFRVLYMFNSKSLPRDLNQDIQDGVLGNADWTRERLKHYSGRPNLGLISVDPGDLPSAVIGLDREENSGMACMGYKGEWGREIQWGVRINHPDVVSLLVRSYEGLAKAETSKAVDANFWQESVAPHLSQLETPAP